jgi:hypothetical protein
MSNIGTKQYIGGGLKRIKWRCPLCDKKHTKRMPWPGRPPKKRVPKFCGEHRKMANNAAEEFIYYG